MTGERCKQTSRLEAAVVLVDYFASYTRLWSRVHLTFHQNVHDSPNFRYIEVKNTLQ